MISQPCARIYGWNGNGPEYIGVHLSSDLTWNVHIEYIVKKASKRLYALRSLKKAGVQPSDLVGIYCALIRSALEYAAPA